MTERPTSHTFILTVDELTIRAAAKDPHLMDRIRQLASAYDDATQVERGDGLYLKQVETR